MLQKFYDLALSVYMCIDLYEKRYFHIKRATVRTNSHQNLLFDILANENVCIKLHYIP